MAMIDTLLIYVYLAPMVIVGFYANRKQKDNHP